MTWLTLFSDASFCPKSKVAGWAGWIKHNGLTSGVFVSGPLLPQSSPSNSELRAIISTIAQARLQGHMDHTETVMVQSDCVWALQQLMHFLPGAVQSPKGFKFGRTRKPTEEARIAILPVGTMLGRQRLILRHIKGHSSKDGGRSWVNEQCDTLAKFHMRKQRDAAVSNHC